MKKIISAFLCWTCFLSAIEIPAEEILADKNLTISSWDNGIEVWLKPYALPKETISCRFIAKNPLEAVPQVFSLDCASDEFEDQLPYFVDLCKESIVNEAACKMSVVAVGDFEEKSLAEFLGAAFEVFSQSTAAPSVRMVSVTPSAESDMVYLSLTYPTSFQEIKTDQDLKKLWVLYLLQSIVEERFRKTAKEVNGQWIPVGQAKYFLPYANSIAKGKQRVFGETKEMLPAFLTAIKSLKSSGFSEQELSDAKAKLQKNLLNFYQENPTNSTLADYLASHCAFGAGHPAYSTFMTLSFKAISKIEKNDVADMIGLYFRDATRCVEIAVPPSLNIHVADIIKVLDTHKTDDLVLNIDDQISNGIDPVYSKLLLTEDEGATIYKIIDALGNWGIPKLFKKEAEMTELGNKVQHVHPFKFLEKVINTPELKTAMLTVEDGFLSLKWRGFFEGSTHSPGFTAKCEREFAKDNLDLYIVGFCQAVKANPEQVRFFVEKKEWEKLVRFLIKLEN
jgi:hypothetical protein